jgi:hypothetical protein
MLNDLDSKLLFNLEKVSDRLTEKYNRLTSSRFSASSALKLEGAATLIVIVFVLCRREYWEDNERI